MTKRNETIRTIAIFAHVDAGKTTITEQLLYISGAISTPGRVDHGTTVSDELDIEKERGISVKASTVTFSWRGITINLIDTPGHADFSSEVESALNCVDAAILVISAAKGVQPQTKAVWRALQALKIPTIIFINKIDRVNSNCFDVLAAIQKEMTPDIIPLESIINEGIADARVVITDFSHTSPQNDCERIVAEKTAEKDEQLFASYCEDEAVAMEHVKSALINAVENCILYPVLFGAAITGTGIVELLDVIVDITTAPVADPCAPLSAYVYKIENHTKFGKLTYIKLVNGTITVMDAAYNPRTSNEEKMTRIRKKYAKGWIEIDSVSAGDVAMVSGLKDVLPGDILGIGVADSKSFVFSEPVLNICISACDNSKHAALVHALMELTAEDPHLAFRQIKETGELHISVMGKMQIEILNDVLKRRYSIVVDCSSPSVIYKETPLKKAEGYIEYTMPKPCWAVMRFLVEPGERGSGVIYSSKTRTSDIAQKYQNEVERAIPEVLKQGIYGWEVTDVIITLVDGEDHEMHSRPSDFTIAAHMGIMDGLKKAGTTLLEPMWTFEISAPEEFAGKILYDLTQMRGEFENPETANGYCTVRGFVPVASAMDYPVTLISVTGGKGSIGLTFAGYRECPLELGISRPRIGIDPLDKAKFILYARNAIQ